MPAIWLSPHFSLRELTASATAERLGIDNAPSADVLGNLSYLAARLEEVRDLVEQPLSITSGFRCSRLNEAVGGVSTSAHLRGLAADMVCPRFGSPLKLCRTIAGSGIGWDQLIYEHGWAHLGFDPVGIPRRQILTRLRDGAYVAGLREIS